VLLHWARLLNTAVFGATPPDDDLADEAWNTHARLVDALRAVSPRWRRIRIIVDPRPLLDRSVPGRDGSGQPRRAARTRA
jgi:hypothetical protein